MKKYVPLLIGCFYSFSAFSFEITSKIQEGALIYGQLNKDEKLLIGSTEIIPTKEGNFFFGLPQDSTKLHLTLIHSNGKKEIKNFSVEKRKWKEEIVTGLQPEKVAPSNKNTKRIQQENQLLREARGKINTSFFPTCFERPVKKFKRISSPFGARRILNNIKKAGHSGVDYAAPIGTPLYSPADGVVALAHKDMFLSGKTLLINHGYGLFSSYSHLNKISVKEGDVVKKGELIAEVGNTGRSTGPHLHYTITWYGTRLDPEQQIEDFNCSK